MITKVLLRDRQSHRYYAGPGHWVAHANHALDLGDTSRAAQIFEEEGIHFGEILVDSGTLPVAHDRAAAASKHRPHARGHRHS